MNFNTTATSHVSSYSSVSQFRSSWPTVLHVFDVSLLHHTCFKWSARHQALQWPDKEPFIWIRCGGGGDTSKTRRAVGHEKCCLPEITWTATEQKNISLLLLEQHENEMHRLVGHQWILCAVDTFSFSLWRGLGDGQSSLSVSHVQFGAQNIQMKPQTVSLYLMCSIQRCVRLITAEQSLVLFHRKVTWPVLYTFSWLLVNNWAVKLNGYFKVLAQCVTET